MDIHFPERPPVYSATNLTVVFPALVDGHRVECAISVEALEDHFGVESTNEVGWLRAFDRGRACIEQAARFLLEVSAGAPVLLRSGHFPPGAAAVGVSPIASRRNSCN
jgi:hypothetical protein